MQEASLKKERSTMNDEQRERLLIAEQIERAEREALEKREGTSMAGAVEENEVKQEELQREEGEKKVVLALSARPTVHSSSATPSEGLKFGAIKPAANLLKANSFKRANPLKQASSSSSATDKSSGKHKETPLYCGETRLGRPRTETSADGARKYESLN